MQRAGLSVMMMAILSLPAVARADAPGAQGLIVLAGGTDIVRILPPEPQVTPPPPAPPTVPVAPPAPPVPEAIVTPPPTTIPPTPEKKIEAAPRAGAFTSLRVRLGRLQTDQSKAYLGANFDSLDRPLAISIGLISPAGALITETFSGSPAVQGGLKPGDVVVKFNGRAVTDPADFRQQLLGVSPGAEIDLEVWRYVAAGSDFVSTLRSYAEQGNVAVMYRLGVMYNRAVGVPRDEGEAVRWFRQAANAGNPQAMTDLALMMFEGRGTERNTTEGLRLLKSAADTGSGSALWHYGLVLQEGKYVTKDLPLAAQMFQRGAENGYSPAMVNLALMLTNGTGVTRNYQEAARWYEKAMALGNVAAMVNLGLLYQRGQGVEKNDTRAAQLYQRGVDLNNPTGMQNLAALLDKGLGTPRDSERAAELVMRALRARYEFSYRQMIQNGGSYSREFRMAMQRRLKDEGVYTGPIDGDFGQTTQAAITTFFNRRP